MCAYWRAAVADLLSEGVRRGEVRAGLDNEAVADVLFGPIYYRLMLERQPLTDRLAEEHPGRVLARHRGVIAKRRHGACAARHCDEGMAGELAQRSAEPLDQRDVVGLGQTGRVTPEDRAWTLEDHLRAGSEDTVSLFETMRSVIASFGPGSISVSKTAVTFKGTRRGFAGASPTKRAVVGYLDLMRQLPADTRIRSASPYGRNLYVHHYVLHNETEFDDEFISWLREAYAVGCGAHLLHPPTVE